MSQYLKSKTLDDKCTSGLSIWNILLHPVLKQGNILGIILSAK